MDFMGLIIGGIFGLMFLMFLGWFFLSEPGYILIAAGIGLALWIIVRAAMEKFVPHDSQWED